MIGISELTTFLPHVGARLGHYEDPPTDRFCVEGGRYNGDLYVGVVFQPPSPTAGTTRIDAFIANSQSGNLERIAGTENSGIPPDISAYVGAGLLCYVTVIGRMGGKVVIERPQIADLRSVIPARPSSFRLMEVATITMGTAAMPAVNSFVGSWKVVGTKVWTYAKAKVAGKKYVTSGNALTWIDLEYPRAVPDLHLMVQPYDSLFAAAPNQSGDHPDGVGVTWVSLGNVSGLPRVRIVVGAAEGFGGESGHQVFALSDLSGGSEVTGGRSMQVHFQTWGRNA